jgi:hypothetical protein
MAVTTTGKPAWQACPELTLFVNTWHCVQDRLSLHNTEHSSRAQIITVIFASKYHSTIDVLHT